MNRQTKVILASVLLSFTSYICAAGPMPPPPGSPPPPPGFPIDSYIIYGILTALFIGVRKIVVGINRREN